MPRLVACLLLVAMVSASANVPLLGQAGYIEVNSVHMWYWFFPAEVSQPSAPLLLWLQGGPGASGADGLFYGAKFLSMTLRLITENGPYDGSRPDGEIVRRDNGGDWTKFANCIFLDQPAGVGFTYSTDKHDYHNINVTYQMSLVDQFLRAFLETRQPALSTNPLYIFGESYGGHYAPRLGAMLLQNNALQGPDGVVVNLRGVGLGDGWVDPYTQYPAYVDFAYDLPQPHLTHRSYEQKLIGDTTKKLLEPMLASCLSDIKVKGWVGAAVSCNAVVGVILAENPGMSFYDIRLICPKKHAWVHDCYNFTAGPRWMQTPAMRKFLNVSEDLVWKEREGVDSVIAAVDGDEEDTLAYAVRAILEAGVPLLVYNGDSDFAANHLGAERWTSALEWSGAAAFAAANTTEWRVNGTLAGWRKSAHGLTYVKVKDAGHMVPMNQPTHAAALVAAFLDV